MNRKLFVGSLSWHTTDQTLAGHFRDFGEVEEARVITDRETGRSRGFGFVTMDTEEAAQVAMEALHQSSLDGRTINVQEAKERRSESNGHRPGARRVDAQEERKPRPEPREVEVIHRTRLARADIKDDEGEGGQRMPKKRPLRR